ncbi:MAG: O-antigen ligase family protein [Vicinamibacterales bacterium]
MPSLSDSAPALGAALAVVAVVTAIRPRWALLALLAGLPFFTHHAATRAALWLTCLVGTFEVAYVLRARPSMASLRSALGGEPVLLAAALFAAAALASLSSLPLLALWQEHAAALRLEPLPAWPAYLASLLTVPEARPEFAITSALLSVQGLVLALVVRREARASVGTALGAAAAVVLGTTAFVLLGLAESAGLVDLTPLRGEASVAYRAGTLQSSAGNPGWFSQLVVYALPYGLVLLAIDAPAWRRLAAMAATSGIGALALAAAFQRGGWVVGAVDLAAVAAGTVWWMRRHDGAWLAAHRRRLLALSMSVGLAVPVGVWLWTAAAAPGAPRPDGRAFAERLASIPSANRLVYARVGLRMAALHPVLGGGHESFALRYLMYVQSPGGPLEASPLRVPDAASAHSVYMQTLTGTGVVGLAALLAMFAAAGVAVAAGLKDREMDPRRQAVLLAAGGSLLGIAGYGLVQEVFYIHVLRLLFFVALGLVAGVSSRGPRLSPRAAPAAWSALAVLLAVHLVYEYRWPGPDRLLARAVPTGLAGEERGPSGEAFQWATIVATWPPPDGATTYSLQVRSLAPFAQTVELTPCAGPAARVALTDHAWHRIEGALDGCGRSGRVYLRTSPGWRPGGTGNLLGVMVSDVRLH